MADQRFRDEATTTQLQVEEPDAPVRRVFRLEVLRGAHSGELVELRGPKVTIGRDPSSDICLQDAALSRLHAAFEWRDRSWTLSDLGSRNGTFVDGRRVNGEKRLVEGDRISLGGTMLRFSVRDASEALLPRDQQARDALTGLADRTTHERGLSEAFSHACATGTSLAVMMVDLDDFSRCARKYGRNLADDLLRDVAKAITSTLGPGCEAARYRGDEFAVYAPGMDDSRAQLMAQRVRAAIGVTEVRHARGPAKVTASIGVALHRSERSYRSARDLVSAATDAQRQSKQMGKNRVTFSQELRARAPQTAGDMLSRETVSPHEES